MEELRFFAVIKDMLHALRRDFVFLCGLAIIVVSGAFAFTTALLFLADSDLGMGARVTLRTTLFFAAIVLQALIATRIVEHRQASVRQTIVCGLRRTPSIILVFVVFVGIGAVGPVFFYTVGLSGVLPSAIQILPGLVILVMLWITVPIVILEDAGFIEALSRSIEMTQGFRWKIFGIIVVAEILGIGIGFALEFALHVASGENVIAKILGTIIFLAVGSLLHAVAPIVAYHHLLQTEESERIRRGAAIFD